jgi:hypothetical protein
MASRKSGNKKPVPPKGKKDKPVRPEAPGMPRGPWQRSHIPQPPQEGDDKKPKRPSAPQGYLRGRGFPKPPKSAIKSPNGVWTILGK